MSSPIVKDQGSSLTEAAENWKSKVVPGTLQPGWTDT